MNKLSKLFMLAVATSTLAFSGVASAAQVDGGNIYYSQNVTQNSAFGDPTSANPCDTVLYRVRLHNGGPEVLDNVNVRIDMPSNEGTSFSSTATTTASNGVPAVVSDTASVTSSATTRISFVPGSAQLLDANHGVISSLSDSLVTTGVDVGSVGVSTQQIRFVQFRASLSCPTTPPETPENPGVPTPETLPETGAGNAVAVFVAVTAVSTLAYSVVSRRLSRQ